MQQLWNVSGSFGLQNTIAEWSYVFAVGAIAYIVPSIVFLLFGSGEIQPWNERQTTRTSESSAHRSDIDVFALKYVPSTEKRAA